MPTATSRSVVPLQPRARPFRKPSLSATSFSDHPCLEQAVLDLLKAGANVNAADEDGWTALMQACDGGNEQCVHALIEAGADMEKPDNEGFTPLMSCCQNGHDLCARALLEAGADKDKELPGYPGANALAIAKQAGHSGICNLLA